MMAELWRDIERDLESSCRHFGKAIEGFARALNVSDDEERYFRRAAFMHAMLAGYTSFENAMRRVTGLLDETLPIGSDWHKSLIDRLAEPIEGRRPAILDSDRLLIAVDTLRGFRHVAIHAYDRFDDDRAALAAAKAEVFVAEIGPALARFRAAIDPD